MTSYPLIKIWTPNYFVAACNQLARLTLGDKYDASILWSDPIAPSIAHPRCKPNPIFTLKSLTQRNKIGLSAYFDKFGLYSIKIIHCKKLRRANSHLADTGLLKSANSFSFMFYLN